MSRTEEDDPRMLMAAERTFLSWLRTGVSLMGFGFVVARFALFLREIATTENVVSTHHGVSLRMGIALILAGAGVIIAASIRFRRSVDMLRRGSFSVEFETRFPTVTAACLAVLGVASVLYLALL